MRADADKTWQRDEGRGRDWTGHRIRVPFARSIFWLSMETRTFNPATGNSCWQHPAAFDLSVEKQIPSLVVEMCAPNVTCVSANKSRRDKVKTGENTKRREKIVILCNRNQALVPSHDFTRLRFVGKIVKKNWMNGSWVRFCAAMIKEMITTD